ncbi:MAG: AMP-binding protein, partial [Psychrosphaera sp.]|nr:AMP-binding protein [Psychrosphaera sp.]
MATNIGQPMKNTRLYVLDPSLSLVPVGVGGELYVGGHGVGLGYLNRAALTAQKFIDNPFAASNQSDKIYRTGDLVRWQGNGELVYLGRCDAQVKISGHRIELGEIEAALLAHQHIKQAVVIEVDAEHNQSHKKSLAAYVVSEPEALIELADLAGFLALTLPQYMVPASFNRIDSVKQTINGKVDHKALPEPKFVSAVAHQPPRNALQVQLCTLWQTVLGCETVGINVYFFRLGGDSVKGIELVGKLRKAGWQIQVKDLFDAPTVAQLALYLDGLEQGEEQQVEEAEPLETAQPDNENLQQIHQRYLQQGYQIEALHSANSLQQGFVYQYLNRGDDAYLVQVSLDYAFALDFDVYRQAWVLASRQFPALR